MNSRFSRTWLIAASCLSSVASAQVAPDAGRILTGSERPARRELPPATAPSTGVTSTPAATTRPTNDAARQVRVYVRRFIIPADLALTQEEVDEALKGKLGREMNFIEIFECLDVISGLLKKKGYPFARVFLPEQKVNVADIRVRVYTGTVESIEAVSVNKKPTTPPKDVARRVGSSMNPGQPFRTPDAERGLLLAGDLVGRPVSGQLTPGKEVGTTKLTVTYQDVPATSWQVGVDNFGNKFAGSERLSGDGRIRSTLTPGDLINFGLTLSDNLTGYRLGYTTPIGYSGWIAGLNYSDISYSLAGTFAGFEGDAREMRATTSYPIIRSRTQSLYAEASFASRDLSTVNGPFNFPRTVDVFSLGVRGEAYDSFFSGGVSSGDLTFISGDASAESFLDPANFRGANGSYSKILLNLSRLQRLGEKLTGTASLRVQRTSDNLDTSEQGSLGGPFGVRAYANEEASGDEYAILSLELQHPISHSWSGKAFYDHGSVTITKNVYPGFSGAQDYSLKAIGVGADWSGKLLSSDSVFSVTFATTVGSNDGLNSQGLDSEGGSSDTRIWMSLTSRF